MQTILIAILLSLDILKYMIFIHIIFSWISLLGVNIKLSFIDSILNPIYNRINSIFPCRISGFDFTPIVLIFILFFIKGLVIAFDSNIINYYNQII